MSPRRYPVISGRELIRQLRRVYGYEIIRQRGSHIRIRTYTRGKHSLTVPDYKELDRKILDSILAAVAQHRGVSKKEIIDELFQ
jgi:predicted RNA binding protein YcfA (HicA-like mRNA interferase family)